MRHLHPHLSFDDANIRRMFETCKHSPEFLREFKISPLLQPQAFVLGVNEALHFLSFVITDGWLEFVFVVIIEDLREHVADGFALGVAHRMDGGVDVFGYKLMK